MSIDYLCKLGRPSATMGLIVLSLLTSCTNRTSPTDLVVPWTVPEAWQSAPNSAQPVSAGWLHEFNDSKLIEISQQALANNPDLKIVMAQRGQALHRFRALDGSQWPNLASQLDASRHKNVSSQSISYQNQFSLDLVVSWEWDLWQRLGQRSQAAAWNYAATEADVAALRLSLVANVARSWFDLMEAGALVTLLKMRQKNLEDNHQLLTERFKEGLSPALDVLLARTDLKQTSVQLVQQRQQLEVVKRRLLQLVGEYPDGVLEVAFRLPDLPKPVYPGLPADLLKRRPDVMATHSRAMAAHALTHAAEADRYPKLMLTAGGGTASEELKSIVRDGNLAWSMLANFSQPLFDARRLKSLSEEALEAQREAEAQYHKVLLAAFTEVEVALSSEAYLRSSTLLNQSVLETAQQALSLAQKQYNEGLVDYATLLAAQRRAFDSQIALIQTKKQLLHNRVNLNLALGNGLYYENNPQDSLGSEINGS
ncbi:MAG TPA: hypothetical protein DCZ03_14560 [Gammaproteobacteria bacterium]|nr:hypothetical protein [Gammaproteobacteria bacterium]